MARKPVPFIGESLRMIRDSLAPGTTIRSFGRLMGIENTYLGWESKNHAPGEVRLAGELRKLPGMTEARAKGLAHWAHTREGELPTGPPLPTEPRVARPFPTSLGAIVRDIKTGAISERDAERLLKALLLPGLDSNQESTLKRLNRTMFMGRSSPIAS